VTSPIVVVLYRATILGLGVIGVTSKYNLIPSRLVRNSSHESNPTP
jgi:hypothetical protein